MQPKVEELSQTIQEWLNWPRDTDEATEATDVFDEKAMRDGFRRNLEDALGHAIKSSITIARLIDIFSKAGKASGLTVVDKAVAIYLGAQPEIFSTLRTDVQSALDEGVNSGLITAAESEGLADLVVTTLKRTLSNEARSADRHRQDTPEDIFFRYLIPTAIRRQYNVRTFLVFFGLIVIAS